MTCRHRFRPVGRKLIPAFAGLMLIVAACCAARADTVKIDEVSKPLGEGTLTLKGIEVVDTNLSEGDVRKILSVTRAGDADELIAKLNASAIAVGTMTFTAPEQTISIRDIRATEVKQGTIARLSIGTVDATGEIQGVGKGTFRIGSATIENADFRAILPGAQAMSRPPVDAGRMVVSDIEVTVPDTDTPKEAPGGNLHRIRLASLTIAGGRDPSGVTSTSAVFDKLVLVPPKFSQLGQALEQAGYDQFAFDIKFAGRHDGGKRTYEIDDLSISWPSVGAITFEAKLGGIDEAAFNSDQVTAATKLAEADISHLAIRIVNLGYFEKAVAEEAAREKKTPEQVKAEWQATLVAMLSIDPSDPIASKLIDAASAFIANPKSLTISLDAKTGPIKLRDFSTITSPDELLALVDLKVVAGQ